MKEVICKDCIRDDIKTVRSVALDKNGKPVPGNRCTTHHRAVTKARKASTHDQRMQKQYGLAPGEHKKLVEYQGGRCYICQRATGATRNLSLDHDHSCCPAPPTCGQCGRGALCGPCNDLLGHARDSIEFFQRGIDYLTDPPLQRMRRESQ